MGLRTSRYRTRRWPKAGSIPTILAALYPRLEASRDLGAIFGLEAGAIIDKGRYPTVTSADILGRDGPLTQKIDGFVVRPSQQAMAASIEAVLENKGVFIAESGTGTGKTFAYLVPALLSGKKILISTGTKHLQDQLFQRDLPLVREALELPVTTALLKGRANYLCLHRLERAQQEDRSQDRQRAARLATIQDWSRRTRTGDISEAREVPEDAPVWPLVTSTADNCIGSQCGHFEDCYVRRARKAALDADILVVNHHLFFADLVIREEGFGRLLPGVDGIIFDEAHQLPEIASNFFGVTVSRQQLAALCRDTVAEELREQSGVKELPKTVAVMEKAIADFRLSLGTEVRRDAWERLDGPEFHQALETLIGTLSRLSSFLETASAKGEGLANCYRRSADLLDRLDMFKGNAPVDHVPWFETSSQGFILHLTPLEVSGPFREHTGSSGKSWIFTSATLAISHSFQHFQTQLGLEEVNSDRWESPFDFDRQTLLYLPQGLPEPSHPGYTRRVIDLAVPVLQASRGRAFVLFTSHRALRLAAEQLEGVLDYPMLVQGSAPRSELLQRFRRAGDAVLLGTGSFWEGVDVRGQALSCVIIDKLPFASPGDPVLRARGAALESQGRNAFMEYQLPNAVIALKQGAGRLIRDERDHGVLMLCDPRLLSKGYGKIFLSSLPPIPQTRCMDDVQQFFNRMAEHPAQKGARTKVMAK